MNDAKASTDKSRLERLGSLNELRMLDMPSLRALSQELQERTIDACLKTGAVQDVAYSLAGLALAIHAVFNLPHDRLAWDDPAHATAHRILCEQFPHEVGIDQRVHWAGARRGNRQMASPPPYPLGGALNTALANAVARDLGRSIGDPIVVIDSERIASGHAHSALRIAVAQKRRILIVALEAASTQQAPISRLSRYLDGLGVADCGSVLSDDMEGLVGGLRQLKQGRDGPRVLHIRPPSTYASAQSPSRRDKARSGQKLFGLDDQVMRFLADTAIDDERMVIVHPSDHSFAAPLHSQIPSARLLDTGSSPLSTVDLAARLAATGLRAVCLLDAYQVAFALGPLMDEVAAMNQPIRLIIKDAGEGAHKSTSPFGYGDIAQLAGVSNLTLMAAGDHEELGHMLTTILRHDETPIALRYANREMSGIRHLSDAHVLAIGKGRIMRKGDEVALLSYGLCLDECVQAAEILAGQGISATVADARFARPLDEEMIGQLARHHRAVLTVEQGVVTGGFGGLVLQHLAKRGALDRGLRFRSVGLPDHMMAGPVDFSRKLDKHHIAYAAIEALGLVTNDLMA